MKIALLIGMAVMVATMVAPVGAVERGDDICQVYAERGFSAIPVTVTVAPGTHPGIADGSKGCMQRVAQEAGMTVCGDGSRVVAVLVPKAVEAFGSHNATDPLGINATEDYFCLSQVRGR